MGLPRPSMFVWQITAALLLCVAVVQHLTVTTLTERLTEIEELARIQNGWVFFDIKDE
jgi:hypothetical protein